MEINLQLGRFLVAFVNQIHYVQPPDLPLFNLQASSLYVISSMPSRPLSGGKAVIESLCIVYKLEGGLDIRDFRLLNQAFWQTNVGGSLMINHF